MPLTLPETLPALYRSAAIRRIEAAAVAAGIDEATLMARAGQAAWRFLLEHWPQAQRIGVVCGPGNNGGDGYVLAELARASGRRVRVLHLGDAAQAGDVRAGAAREAALAYLGNGGVVERFEVATGLGDADVWVDALFGIGLSRAPDAAAAALIDALNAQAAPVLAIDVPSGLDADTGHTPGIAVRAAATISFIAGKTGLYTGRARAHVGHLRVADIGVPPACFDGIDINARRLAAEYLPGLLPRRARTAHKGDCGRVLCVGGDHGMGGAVALCAEAAHRVGAGLVSVATRAEHVPVLLTRRPESMPRAVDDAATLAPLLAAADVVAAGPGLGQAAWGTALHDAVVDHAVYADAPQPVVFDADALNMLARRDARALPGCVLTPHPGEAARLLSCTAAEVERDRMKAVRQLAARYACAVLLKGAGTLVAAPGCTPVLIDAGNPGMACGGMGDTLTGTIAGLLAQWPESSFAAAAIGALLHAVAADHAAEAGGERGLLASDLFPQLRALANAEAR